MSKQSISTIVDQILDRSNPSWEKINLTKEYTKIAERLSLIANKNPSWKWRYVQGVHSGTVAPSPRFAAAARVLLDHLTDSTTPIYSQSETVQILAQIGIVETGSWVLTKSRPCADPTCTIIFVPRVPWQIYCPMHAHK
jgi:hypothetical protein